MEYTFRDTPCEVQSVSQKILAFLLSSHDDTILLKDVEEALHLDHSTTSQAIEQIRPFIFAWSPPSDPGTLYLHQRSQLDNLEEYKYLLLSEKACQEEPLLWGRLRTLSPRPGFSGLPGVDRGRFQYASNALDTDSGLATVDEELRDFLFPRFTIQEDELDGIQFSSGLQALVPRLPELVSHMLKGLKMR